ncbi:MULTISPECIES: YeeE/YedE family protein [Photobacterium]|uniref:YeeE/YedE family protein n=1 Tax=Photobacterium TaxID=657 RepID=UPI001C2CF964|nr:MULTISPECIES: YeeE/YedE thiosulfate transporter family protein [Photobacterium]MBV1840967.1 YeeE/YedE family protein [Photobacterium ganghwense]
METWPWHALFGGMMLGASATILLLFNGRVAGISGILSGILKPQQGDVSWRLLFVIGMVAAGLCAPLMGFSLPQALPVSSLGLLAVAGLLVGIGTKLANGCTSGHGICGMGRFSKRSLVATMVFMATAIATVFLRFHL